MPFKKFFCVYLFFYLALFSSLFLASFSTVADEKKFHIVIDPGHGGNDVGAIKNQIKESNLVLAVAQKIEQILKNTDPGLNVTLTRTKNSYLSLADRIRDTHAADLFLSLHANSSISNKVSGMETYFQIDQKLKSSEKTESVVESIVSDLESIGKTERSLQFSKDLQKNWNHSSSVIRRSPFFVIEKTKSPALLIEIGFLTNTDEAKKLATNEYQNAIAETIVKTILDYKKSNQ